MKTARIAILTIMSISIFHGSICSGAESAGNAARFFDNYKKSVRFNNTVMSFKLDVAKKEEASGKIKERELKSETSGKIFIGDDRYRVEFSGGSIDGTVTIVLGTEAWVYYPDTKRVKNYKSKVRRQGMLGGALTMEDFLIIGDIQKYYRETSSGKAFVEMEGTADWLTYVWMRITFDPEKLVPSKIDFGRESGTILKTLEFGNYKKFGNIFMPSKIVASLPVKNLTSTWVINGVDEKKTFSSDLFDPEKLNR